MSIVKVFYADWEMGCCGTPFSVGDEVEWRVHAEKVAEKERATWQGIATERGELLQVSNHYDPDRTVAGRVRAIHIVTLGFQETRLGSQTSEPVPGEIWLRSEHSCPKWFASDPGPAHIGRRAGRGYYRREAGAVIEVEPHETPDK